MTTSLPAMKHAAVAVASVMKQPIITVSAVFAEVLRDDDASRKAVEYTKQLALATAVCRVGATEWKELDDTAKQDMIDACRATAKVYAEKAVALKKIAADRGLDVLAICSYEGSDALKRATSDIRAWLASLQIDTMSDLTTKLLKMSNGKQNDAKTSTANGNNPAPSVAADTTNAPAHVTPASMADQIASVMANMPLADREALALALLPHVCGVLNGMDECKIIATRAIVNQEQRAASHAADKVESPELHAA